MSKYVPEEFETQSGCSEAEKELRIWLHSIPLAERINFIKRLWPLNYRFTLSLVRSSQIPISEVVELLEHWLSLGQHNAAQGLIEGLEPVLGEHRFWKVATQVELTPAMEDFLNYHGHGQLAKYKTAVAERSQNGKQVVAPRPLRGL